jgi:Flp pilus assembly pilin Flp
MKLTQSPRLQPWRKLFRQLLEEEQGAVSVETMLIIAAIALPILIFIIKFGWPRIKTFFNNGMNDLEGGAGAGAAGT